MSVLRPPAGPRQGWHGLVLPVLAAAILTVLACQPTGGPGGSPTGSPAGSAGAASPSTPGGSAASAAPGTRRLTIATGGTGGVYFPLGGGLAQQLSQNIEGVTATAQETSASVDNMLLIGTGGADIAFVLGDTAADAVAGRTDDFANKAVDACTLGILYSNFTQVVTTGATGIDSIEDLAGKRVSVGAPGSGTEVIALRILEAAGIDPGTGLGSRAQLLIDETVTALRDGTIDAGFWSGGLPTGALQDLPDLKLIPTAAFTDALADEHGPFYLQEEIPANTYEGQTEAVPTIVVPNVLVVNKSMDEALQRRITEVLFQQKDALVRVHPAAGELDPTTAGNVEFMEVCPGAKAYYDAR